MYKITCIHPIQKWHQSTAMVPVLASITTFTIGCGTAPQVADYKLWFDTTTSAHNQREFSIEEKDTLAQAIKKLVAQYGFGQQYADLISTTDPFGSLSYLDPYTTAYDATRARSPELAATERFNDNPYGILFEQTGSGAKIIDIKRSRKCKLQLMCGQTISMIGKQHTADLSSDELALALYRAASHGTNIEILYGSVGKRKGKLPAISDFAPSFITSRMLDASTGYIRFAEFSNKIDEWIELMVGNLQNQGMKYLLLDLRGNGGGFISGIFNISKLFSLNTGKDSMVIGGLSESKYFKGHFRDTRFHNLPLLVLVDRGTASAAEGLAGAFQDRDRAVIIGEQTYGKGTTISEYELPYHQLLWLANGRVFLPSGRCVERPYRGRTRCDSRLHFEETNNFEHTQEALYNDTSYPAYYYSVSRNLKRPLYGHMGIIPDYIVEPSKDTNSDIQYFKTGIPRYLAAEYVSTMLDENQRDSITYYNTPDQFMANFVIPDDLMKQVMRTKDYYKISGDVVSILSNELQIRKQFRVMLTKELYGMGYYSQERLLADPVVREALKHRDIASRMVK